MKRGFPALLASVGSGLAGLPLGVAPSADDLSIQVGECVELETVAERYACYERQVAAALTEAHRESTHDDEVARSSRRDDPVQGAEQTPSAHDPARSAAPDGLADAPSEAEQPGQIVSTIAVLTERLPNEHVITLENGQTWRQKGTDRYPLRVGHRVRIFATRWGDSYRLAAEELNGFIQVERVR